MTRRRWRLEPLDPEAVHVSAYGERAATVAAEVGDGLYTVGPQGDVYEAFTDAGGEGPAYGQLTLSYAETEADAVDAAYERWPTTALPGSLSELLPTPAHFEQAADMVSRDDIAEGSTLCDPDPQAHVETIEAFVDAGYDHVTIHQVGTDHDGFFECYRDEVLPAL